MAAQLLLDFLSSGSRDRWRITGALECAPAGVATYSAALGLGSQVKALLVPVIHRPYRSAMLSVLKTANPAQCRVGLGGMPTRGATTVACWGDSGQCELRWSRGHVERHRAAERFDTMSDDRKRAMAATYGDTMTLLVGGQRVAQLPPTAQCDKVFRALHGEAVIVSDAEMDLIEPVLCAGLRLVTAPNPQRLGLLDAYLLQLPPARPH
ncbi:hypothetical protein [Rubrivivax gelatinosus]|uniref:hypothetical protein n=1 Tax=Rubrivivax gelatinosus TaxID=28068 RepID=UPI0002F990A4|nr:hypothetical protein [Rubrivivax gelatinosus]MBG6083033.1 hypothetical protein [Rubrivivax gelatinosus]